MLKQQKPKQLGSLSCLPSWEQRFKELKAFKKAHGHCNVPYNYQPNPALARWVSNIRHAKKHGKIAEERIHRLDALCFFWNLKRNIDSAAVRKQRINELKAFKKEHGHCNVSGKDKKYPALAHWVSYLRRRKNRGKIDQKTIKCLDALDFSWGRRAWKQHVHDLKVFKNKNGHCKVPFRYPLNPTLGQWVNSVRQWKKQGKLTEDKILILDALDFTWMIKMRGIRVPWKQRIHDLKAFKNIHGHCNVPYEYPPKPALGHWVNNVRQQKKLGTLTEDRILRLDALGFVWKSLKRRPSQRLENSSKTCVPSKTRYTR